jgi:hypothetical protein
MPKIKGILRPTATVNEFRNTTQRIQQEDKQALVRLSNDNVQPILVKH